MRSMTRSIPTKLSPSEWPPALSPWREIPEPPRELWCQGALPDASLALLTVVGSRAYSRYGKQAVEHLIGDLRGYPVGIVSGLALGIDALAHEAALRHGLYTLAIPGSGLDERVLYPARNRALARRILASGGALLSEFPPECAAAPWTFPRRNRLMAGLSRATLLIEAAALSGTLITARLAADYNRELLVVPGSIFDKNSEGAHQFLKLGATPVTCAEDILAALKLPSREKSPAARTALTARQEKVLTLLKEPCDLDTLIRSLKIDGAEAATLLMEMELLGLVASENSVYRALR
jgi:DNA processing protein